MTWDESYADLVAYHKEHGHSNVSQMDKEYPTLGIILGVFKFLLQDLALDGKLGT
jgi:hypothetical protein